MTRKEPNPIDRHVGSRVRTQRMLAGVSQERLGDALGVTFQQVQKYEKGTNRISASRLQQIANLLEVEVSVFFQGAPSTASLVGAAQTSASEVLDFTLTSEGVQLNRAFVKIKSNHVRRKLVDLAEALAAEDDRG
ncbi:helix-turn-helix transcriptional regulator [Bosea sp. (in: a-proteobacteria)]|jgi:transcriptional regulator with XRE-family HTH domain|uniref:helix-turn-helix domain-containing protein n=1 Tax=Bosea sp. (in: a-proteobacteria) TaxID=1871050 RepID=UPI002DDD3BA4|nr:helix-turn-helix transcriptional regulator [Bosea sp. (in: a-proteobacteria)]HEV2508642.1 helix-turn-helix transcriptional regulator [Bosea sp. (in: a-proteobacteria)]